MSLSYSTGVDFLGEDRALSSWAELVEVASAICLVSDSRRGVVVPDGTGLLIGVSRT